jgi:hypothetical protein
MENQEYIIVNKAAIQKRIEELEKEMFFLNWNAKDAYEDIGKLSAYKKILSQSTHLIPEIEKAFDVGVTSVILKIDNEEDNTVGYSKGFITKKTGESVELYPREQIKQDYITNLKLDI